MIAENIKIQPGYRFTLRHDVDRYPDFVARQGNTGTVTAVQADGLIVARMDNHIEGAEQWDNELWWNDDGSGFLDDTVPLVAGK